MLYMYVILLLNYYFIIIIDVSANRRKQSICGYSQLAPLYVHVVKLPMRNAGSGGIQQIVRHYLYADQQWRLIIFKII